MRMSSVLAGALVKAAIALLVANEIRGILMAAPLFYSVYEAGGTPAAIWIGVCALAGVALSVIVPLFVARRLRQFF